ncbi:protein arginine N-methyltransferase 1 [Scaptodrosophila lebanonensis]|uniref:Protein arginine N-methyltransferase 6 n=1 Tax=Drosophila lebanonensis TaxID=7225 RepID=A0A6J2UF05_DROLE|nr:protein arginine N-methyltransferase 1 [Scaptodrosophila lebanonensis]
MGKKCRNKRQLSHKLASVGLNASNSQLEKESNEVTSFVHSSIKMHANTNIDKSELYELYGQIAIWDAQNAAKKMEPSSKKSMENGCKEEYSSPGLRWQDRNVVDSKQSEAQKKKTILKRNRTPKVGAEKLGTASSGDGDKRKGAPVPCLLSSPHRYVPPELAQVDLMTSADFREDYSAHIEFMRMTQKDQQHMDFFQKIIGENRHLFEGRTILVLRCGPGTLALMAARAGATRVYAVDHSKVTGYAELVVKSNRYENIVHVMHGRVADIHLPEEQGVDGIVCCWMGHCLLYESEILEVLQARDRWLKPGGFILPDLGRLYLIGAAEQVMKNQRCNWWLDVYDMKMSIMRRYSLAEPRYVRVTPNRILTLAHNVLSLDLTTATVEDLQIDRTVHLQVQEEQYLECFVLYFDVEFSRAHMPLTLSCNPWLKSRLKSTWLQTVLFIDEPFMVRKNLKYLGRLILRPLQKAPTSLNEMRFEIELNQYIVENIRRTYTIDRTLVNKAWLMMQRKQTVEEVESCQDERVQNQW